MCSWYQYRALCNTSRIMNRDDEKQERGRSGIDGAMDYTKYLTNLRHGRRLRQSIQLSFLFLRVLPRSNPLYMVECHWISAARQPQTFKAFRSKCLVLGRTAPETWRRQSWVRMSDVMAHMMPSLSTRCWGADLPMIFRFFFYMDHF